LFAVPFGAEPSASEALHGVTAPRAGGRSYSMAGSNASSLYCTPGTMRKYHRRAYVGQSKTPWAEKFLRESLNTHLENVQFVLGQRVAWDGVVQ
jgi:hypothetical protein